MATYHGIIKAQCMNCELTTTDEHTLEIMNDLSADCVRCGFHIVKWWVNEGIIFTLENQEGDSARVFVDLTKPLEKVNQ